MMSGLVRVLRLHGAMTAIDKNGRKVEWLWDYANEVPVTKEDMPKGSERRAASERARWAAER